MEAVLQANGFYDHQAGPTQLPTLERSELLDVTLIIGILMGTGAKEFLFFCTEDAPDGFHSWEEWVADEPEPRDHKFFRDLGCLIDESDRGKVTSYDLGIFGLEFGSYSVRRWDLGHIGYGGRDLYVMEILMEAEGAPSLIAVY